MLAEVDYCRFKALGKGQRAMRDAHEEFSAAS